MPQANRLNLPSASAKQQAERKFLWNEARCSDDAHFYTVGYTGRPLCDILQLLVLHGVRTLVDIRHNPVSMYRPELSKTNLMRSAEEQGLLYVHLRELGVPRDIRARAIEAGSRDVIWDWYDKNVVLSFVGGNLHRFFNMVEHPIALMCVEIDPRECHRHRLFLALEDMGLQGFDL